jgi:hypothetical protein
MEKKKVKIQDNQRLITPEFRVAFPNVFKPQAMKGGTPKFSVTMLFPQQDADLAQDEGMRPLRKAIVAAKIAAFGADKSRWPKCQSPIRDGATPSTTGQVYEGFVDHWVIKATSNENSKPGVFDEKVQPITEPSGFYPGCYAIAYMFAYVWEFPVGKFGVGFILDHVQKQRDGKPFGGKKLGTQVFQPVAAETEEESAADSDSEDADADF